MQTLARLQEGDIRRLQLPMFHLGVWCQPTQETDFDAARSRLGRNSSGRRSLQKRDERMGRLMPVKDDSKPFKGVAKEPDQRDTNKT